MDLHGNAPGLARQEIRCRDCGHVYTVDAGARSSRCEVCGNIEFHGEALAAPKEFRGARESAAASPTAPSGIHFALSPEILESFAAKNASLAEKPGPISQHAAQSAAPAPALPKEDPAELILARFAGLADGFAVQEILERYQVEWQIWAKLVKHFSDPAYHAAYLALATREQDFTQASARYREHRAVMLLAENTRWEAEVADLMISRIETLASLSAEQESRSGFRVPAWVYLLPLQSGPFRVAWITLGLLGMARAFRII